MAKEDVAAAGAPPKTKGKLLIILAIVGVLLLGAGVGGFLLLSKPATEQSAESEEGEEEGDEEGASDGKGAQPIYIRLETFTVNLADQESYLQTDIQLMVANAKVGEKMNARIPEVRDAMIRLLTSKTAEELSTPEGKDKLAIEIQTQINSVLSFKKKSGVSKVLFGAFIIQ
jgi:flagellar protein FliL